jgi:hypothetical protein
LVLVSLLLLQALPVDLSWPRIDCPKKEQVSEFLDALLVGGEVRPAKIESATIAADRLELTIQTEGETVHRAVVLIGPCDRRAATVAAVIEKVLTVDRVATATIAAIPVSEPEEADRGWIGAGGHFAVGSGGELGGGLDLEGGGWIGPIGIGLRGAWRFPVIEPAAAGDVRIDEGRADLLVAWAVVESIAIEARLFGQFAFARSRDIVEPKSAFRFNPGAGLGVRYRFELDPIGIDLAARVLIPFRSQRFFVDGLEVARLPRAQLELAIALAYGF